MYKEYDQLKNQYELETGTLHQAMQRATQVNTILHILVQVQFVAENNNKYNQFFTVVQTKS